MQVDKADQQGLLTYQRRPMQARLPLLQVDPKLHHQSAEQEEQDLRHLERRLEHTTRTETAMTEREDPMEAREDQRGFE